MTNTTAKEKGRHSRRHRRPRNDPDTDDPDDNASVCIPKYPSQNSDVVSIHRFQRQHISIDKDAFFRILREVRGTH